MFKWKTRFPGFIADEPPGDGRRSAARYLRDFHLSPRYYDYLAPIPEHKRTSFSMKPTSDRCVSKAAIRPRSRQPSTTGNDVCAAPDASEDDGKLNGPRGVSIIRPCLFGESAALEEPSGSWVDEAAVVCRSSGLLVVGSERHQRGLRFLRWGVTQRDLRGTVCGRERDISGGGDSK
jgi:hypothetical protein